MLILFPKYIFSVIFQHETDDGWYSQGDITIEGDGAWARGRKAVTHGVWIWNKPFIINGVSINSHY